MVVVVVVVVVVVCGCFYATIQTRCLVNILGGLIVQGSPR